MRCHLNHERRTRWELPTVPSDAGLSAAWGGYGQPDSTSEHSDTDTDHALKSYPLIPTFLKRVLFFF